MKVFISIILFLFLGYTAFSQDYEYKVMAKSGEIEFMKKGVTTWSDLKNGTQLFSGDKLNIPEGAYVLLIHRNGNPVEFKTSGVKEIEPMEVEEGGLTNKYMSYVMTKMAPEEQEKNRKLYAQVTGATERGFKAINLYMNSSSPVYNPVLVIRWTSMGSGKKYKIVMENMFDEVVKEFESVENKLIINLDDKELSSNQLLSVRVHVLEDKNIDSEKYSIQRIEKNEFGKYKAELEELTAALDMESPMSHLIMAEFYEDHKLLLDASTCYEHALSKSNGVDYFQQAYIQFLMRNGWSDVL